MNFQKLIAALANFFGACRIPYMLVGGFAVAYWGYPRQSLDIDIVVDLTRENLKDFIKNAQQHGFHVHEPEAKTIIAKGNRFVMEWHDFRVDCWLPRTRFEKQALENRKRKKLFGQNLWIISAEDLIISKLLIGRPRDLEDIKTVRLRQGRKIKRAYIKEEAQILGGSNLLKDTSL